MSPEYGSTCAIFPIDEETLRYLRLTGRSEDAVALVEQYAKKQGLWHDPSLTPRFSENIELDLSTVVPSIAGPKRPQDRISLTDSKSSFESILPTYLSDILTTCQTHIVHQLFKSNSQLIKHCTFAK
jgi:aconitate hydratase